MRAKSVCCGDCMDSSHFVESPLWNRKLLSMSQLTSRLKWIFAVITAVLAAIIVFQNLEQTKVQILFFTVEMPHAALLAVTLLVGFTLGLSASTLWKVRAWQLRNSNAKKAAQQDSPPVE